MSNITSKDNNGKILVDGRYKICGITDQCIGSRCYQTCIINRIVERLYELEHKEESK